MPKKVTGALNFAADFVLDTFKKVILFAFLLVMLLVAGLAGLSALTYHIVK